MLHTGFAVPFHVSNSKNNNIHFGKFFENISCLEIRTCWVIAFDLNMHIGFVFLSVSVTY